MLPTLRFSLCAAVAVSSIAFAQELPSIRQDTTFPVELRQTIHSNSAKIGDSVEFRTLEAVLIGNGVVVPADAVLLGKVEAVQTRTSTYPDSLLSIRIHTLRWQKRDLPLNAVVSKVYFVRAGYLNDASMGMKPTFLEGIQIVAHISDAAFTEFSSRKKDVILRKGVMLLLRQISPENYRIQHLGDQIASRR
jgi:hypothetical protein